MTYLPSTIASGTTSLLTAREIPATTEHAVLGATAAVSANRLHPEREGGNRRRPRS